MDDSFETLKDDLPEIPDVEKASGKDLDVLLNPPSDINQKTIVQVLKEKIDTFAYKASRYEGSKKQLQQVLIALAMHPFSEKPPVFGYPEAENLYNLGVEVLTEKLLFLQIGMKEQELAKEIREKEGES